ncbi:uncharacterized protein LOC109840857 isoform X2 [Asparagus officinalis]|uniref:uncharacterized protein LOC109840857 isoform X2 n=1 Tax=Asparagus officinalis TaxID=4686 RepID=UPI00098E08E4|nr:uncharacterized protein LOC109840857 isoform X2 [Asparagus officinalis]
MFSQLHFQSPALHLLPIPNSKPPCNFRPFPPKITPKIQAPNFITRAKTNRNLKPQEKPQQVEAELLTEEEEGDKEREEGGEEFSYSSAYRGREDEKQYDRDPEFAEILGSCLDDPQKAQSKIEERIRRKRNNILHTKTGSATPVKVIFNKFDFSNSYIWFEFYNAPLPKDVTLICDLSQLPLDSKRPKYDAIQGANVTPTTFYNIGDLEIQDNLARVWVDIGTSEPLLLDVLVNALTCISSDYVGIKQLVFGGSEFENWKENLTSEDAGYSSHKI